jgi:hypothetical protein
LNDLLVQAETDIVYNYDVDVVYPVSSYKTAYKMIENGYEVDSLKINGFPIDWRTAEAKRERDYPEIRFKEIPIPLWTLPDTEDFIRTRLELHSSPTPEVCSPKERWATEEVWAVRKPGGTRAISLHKSEGEAFQRLKDDLYIEHRPAYDRKCHEYCSVNFTCPYFHSITDDVDLELF